MFGDGTANANPPAGKLRAIQPGSGRPTVVFDARSPSGRAQPVDFRRAGPFRVLVPDRPRARKIERLGTVCVPLAETGGGGGEPGDAA